LFNITTINYLSFPGKQHTKMSDDLKKLCSAVEKGRIETCLSLLKSGVNPNDFYMRRQERPWSHIPDDTLYIERRPIAIAAISGNPDLCALLLDYGADVNTQCHGDNFITHNGDTPLKIAARYGNLDVCKLLLDRGAENINTAFIEAATFGNREVCELLFSRGADFNVRDGLGMTALHHAARCNKFDVCDFLLEIGSDPKATDYYDTNSSDMTRDPEIRDLFTTPKAFTRRFDLLALMFDD
jgi:ankyrin repeat protein